MSTEAKAPPEQGVVAVSAPNPTVAAATVADERPCSITSSKNANTNGATLYVTAKHENGKAAPGYDKKWLDNLNLLRPCIKEDGTMDYSSLDKETQKRVQNFVKDQRKCYRKRENNEPTPMINERFRLLSEARFDFKLVKTNKAKCEKDRKEKKAKKAADNHAKKKENFSAPFDKAKNIEYIEKANLVKKTIPGTANKPNLTKVEEATSESELLANESPKPTPKTSPKDEDSDDRMPASKSSKPAPKLSSPTNATKKTGKPTYIEMAHDAIVSLKDRTGSSIPAISKWIFAHNEHAISVTTNMFKSRLSMAIKQGVKDGRFAKIKNSFKINPEWIKKQKAAAKAKEAAKKKAEKHRQRELDKLKQQKETEKKSAEDKKRKEKELMAEKVDAARKRKRKEEAEARKKFIDQQLRKRRYPIEDTRLHSEDTEWTVKPPEHVIARPTLPQTLSCLIPSHLRVNTPQKYWSSVALTSASGNGTMLDGDGGRDLITDTFHIYHFFCGDVGLADLDHPIPKFSLKTLLYALDEILNGNANRAKALPPLLTHLFVTTLRMLTAPWPVAEEDCNEPRDADLGPVELRLVEDLFKLRKGLNAVSWSQICFFYMNLMERYYASDISLEEGVLLGEGELNMSYLWNVDQNKDVEIETVPKKLVRSNPYLGDSQGLLAKVYFKLQNQAEPWTLKADELMVLLRTLTDDILAKRPDLAEDISGRGAKLNELLKAKRAAVVKYNKVKLAHVGQKKISRPKKPDGNGCKVDDKKDEQADATPREESEKQFVPNATKQQLVAAEKSYNRAVESYENGLNKLISRTEPLCFDRDFNAIYFFHHDPTMLHVEQIKHFSLPSEVKRLGPELTPFSSWHSIDSKPLFDQFLSSLDARGQREDEALKACSALTILKRRLQDEKKENTRAAVRERVKEELERRLENARSACDAEDGRRSGRLAGMAQDELKKLEEEISQTTKAHKEEERQEKLDREKASDYSLLTGLQMVMDLLACQRATRSSKKTDRDNLSEADMLATAPSHKLWIEDSIGGNGTLHILVEALFALEEKCNDLSPWSRQDISRDAWHKQLNNSSYVWAIDCVMQLGPSDDTSMEDQTKKHQADPASATSLASIVTTIKLCLKDLELRVFEISGRKKSIEEVDDATAVNEGPSSDEEDDEELNKRGNCWKVKINALRRVQTTRYGLIRDIIVAAITVARKSHLNQVAAELKAALQLLRPQAGGEARSAAIQVLEQHGGYDGLDDVDNDVSFDELAAANSGDLKADDEADGAEIVSMLCDEVRMIGGSVGGDDFADKSDWSEAIKDCKSVSRLALLIQSFLSKADDVLTQLKVERNNLDSILGLNTKRTSRTKTSIKNHDSSIHIWCNAKLTDKLVKARVQGYPWWPAHICFPLDSVVAGALQGSGYTLISSVGNPGMFLVAENNIVDFAEEADEDLSQYDKSTLEQLHESMSIAKKLWRLRNRGVASPWRKSKPHFAEEKKTAH